MEQSRIAAKLDPVFAGSVGNYAQHLAVNGHYPEATAEFLDAIDLSPTDPGLHLGLAYVYSKTVKPDLAVSELRKAYLFFNEEDIAENIRKMYTASGYEKAADVAMQAHLQRVLLRLKKLSARHRYVSPSAYASVYAGLHDKRNTLRWLETAYVADAHVIAQLREKDFDFVRQEPRFRKIWDEVPFSH